jgi:hemolysin D
MKPKATHWMHCHLNTMIQNRDIGFVQDGDAAEIKIDTLNFTKYGLLHGKVLSVSAGGDRARTAARFNGGMLFEKSDAGSFSPNLQ